MTRALAVALLLAARVTSAPAQAPRQIVHYPLSMVDLSIVADTVSGLQILVQPGAGSKPGSNVALVWLRFDPDSLLEWVNSAFAALRSAAPTAAPKGIQWSRTLLPLGGQGGLALGRSRKNQVLEQKRWLAVGDSALGWQADISGAEADSLLQVFLTLGSASRLDTTSGAPSDSSRVDSRATPDHPVAPRSNGLTGRVAAQYVVGVDGRVEPGSIAILFASDSRLAEPAKVAARETTYHPAQRDGRPVRQVVRSIFYWKQ